MNNKGAMPGTLTAEQEFKLRATRDELKGMSLVEAQEYVVEIFRQMMVKDNLVKHLLKTQ